MKNIKFLAVISIILGCSCANAADQTTPPVKVTAWGLHHGGLVVYKYQVQNSGTNPIDRIFIGFYPPTPTTDGAAELSVAPYYPGATSLWLPQSVSQSPAGWGVHLSYPEESATFALEWIEASQYRKMWPKADSPDVPVAQNPPNIMPPGSTWDQFSVTLPQPQADYAYVQGHANLSYGDNDLTLQIVKGDTIPPTLSVTLTPATLWPPNEKMIPITATISVMDNYDPAPEIRLESITANEMLDSDDIKDASFFTDDRQFQLKAEREGKNMAGRIYTVTYSATDASGNKSIASATVTVPHNMEEHEDAKKKGRKGRD